MEKCSDVRLLMKKAQSQRNGVSDNKFGSLSGKEKAKMLKMMREKKKNTEVMVDNIGVAVKHDIIASTKSDSLRPARNISKVVNEAISKFSGQTNHKNTISNDEAGMPHVLRATTPLDTTTIDDNLLLNDNTFVEVHTSTQIPDPVKNEGMALNTTMTNNTEMSSIPIGFFDNTYEEYQARGLDIKKELEKKDKIQEEELNKFLQSVEEIEDANQELIEEEQENDTLTEQAIQLAYMTKVATLMHATERIKRKIDHHHHDHHHDQNNINSEKDLIIPVEEHEINKVLTLDVGMNNMNTNENNEYHSHIEQDVLEAISKKKKLKRKQKEDAVTNYIPIDFQNWTAKSI